MMCPDPQSPVGLTFGLLSRKAFIYAPEGDPLSGDVVSALKTEWAFLPVRSPEDLLKANRRNTVHLGLMCLGKNAIENASRFFTDVPDKSIRWIALLGAGVPEQRDIMRLVSEHCFDFHRTPLDLDRLRVIMGHAHGMAWLKAFEHNADMADDHPMEFDMVGSSPAMLDCFRNIRKISGVDACVLITGESGTGKELVARAIHERSKRAKGPFVTLNCGAIPSNLIQSELFGYEKGAFTGAHARKIGYIEAANHGTIMLDEIGDMPFELQVNLLRVLQFGKIQRVGGSPEISVDVRIIAATHIDLEKACKEGRFREDLYYRLNVLRISLPPLRERGTDIGLIAQYFFRRFSADYSPDLKGFSPEAMEAIQSYFWPGNVRELINKVKSAVLMSDGPYIVPADLQLPGNRLTSGPRAKTLREIREQVEKEALQSALQKFRNNVSRASQELGITRTTFYELLKKHNIIL